LTRTLWVSTFSGEYQYNINPPCADCDYAQNEGDPKTRYRETDCPASGVFGSISGSFLHFFLIWVGILDQSALII
jgi:hypothetical protein